MGLLRFSGKYLGKYLFTQALEVNTFLPFAVRFLPEPYSQKVTEGQYIEFDRFSSDRRRTAFRSCKGRSRFVGVGKQHFGITH
jgi:hypothetical protein